MKLLLLICCLAVATLASAQVPTTITYAKSPDHTVVINGTAVVSRYDAVFRRPDNTVAMTKNCGKPADAPTLTCALPSGLPVNINLTVTMVAVGPGGSSPGPVSDPFSIVMQAPAPPGKPTLGP